MKVRYHYVMITALIIAGFAIGCDSGDKNRKVSQRNQQQDVTDFTANRQTLEDVRRDSDDKMQAMDAQLQQVNQKLGKLAKDQDERGTNQDRGASQEVMESIDSLNRRVENAEQKGTLEDEVLGDLVKAYSLVAKRGNYSEQDRIKALAHMLESGFNKGECEMPGHASVNATVNELADLRNEVELSKSLSSDSFVADDAVSTVVAPAPVSSDEQSGSDWDKEFDAEVQEELLKLEEPDGSGKEEADGSGK